MAAWTRRRFVGALGLCVLAGGSLRAQERRVLRVGDLLPPDAAAARGAELGAEEAGRAAELLGARFERLAGAPEGVFALVGGAAAGAEAERLGVPFLCTDPAEGRTPGRHQFFLASSPADRRGALARWQARDSRPAEIMDWHPSLTRTPSSSRSARTAGSSTPPTRTPAPPASPRSTRERARWWPP